MTPPKVIARVSSGVRLGQFGKKESLRRVENICRAILPINVISRITKTSPSDQGFMQDQIIASHTCFCGYMDVNC